MDSISSPPMPNPCLRIFPHIAIRVPVANDLEGAMSKVDGRVGKVRGCTCIHRRVGHWCSY